MVKVKDILQVYKGNFRIYVDDRLTFRVLDPTDKESYKEDIEIALKKYGNDEVFRISVVNNGYVTFLKILIMRLEPIRYE